MQKEVYVQNFLPFNNAQIAVGNEIHYTTNSANRGKGYQILNDYLRVKYVWSVCFCYQPGSFSRTIP